MIIIDNITTCGFPDAIRGMRNPMNSWAKSDSEWKYFDDGDSVIGYVVGPNDMDLMQRLAASGKDHAKYRRMIVVWMDILAPLYWWKEFDTYKVGTVANSCSTMHKIAEKEFTYDDFSADHLFNFGSVHDELPDDEKNDPCNWRWLLGTVIDALNRARELYLKTMDKRYWWQMIQLLPSSYNQKRTVMLNYEVLSNIYPARKNHKLDEWHVFCETVEEELPYSWIFTGKKEDTE